MHSHYLALLPGGSEWIVIALVAALLFGARRLPELGKNLGSGMREFKKAITGEADDKHPELPDRSGNSTVENNKAADASADKRSNP